VVFLNCFCLSVYLHRRWRTWATKRTWNINCCRIHSRLQIPLWNQKVHYCPRNTPSRDPTSNHTAPIYTITLHIFLINFNMTHLPLSLQSCPFPSGFSTKTFYIFHNSPSVLLHVLPSPSSIRSVSQPPGPRPGTGPWDQLYRAARGSPGIFSLLSIFHK
jgi:hypothetical protein